MESGSNHFPHCHRTSAIPAVWRQEEHRDNVSTEPPGMWILILTHELLSVQMSDNLEVMLLYYQGQGEFYCAEICEGILTIALDANLQNCSDT